MPIHPLPVISEEEELKAMQRLKPPETVVVRYGLMRQIAELRYEGQEIPGCGTRMVAITPRGMELVHMLTTTCTNGGCGHSITRKQMLEYIDNSGGSQYPFTEEGKVLRVATPDDLREQQKLDADKPEAMRAAKQYVAQLDLPMKLVDAEMLLGGERIVFYFMSENRVDFRELVRLLAGEYHTRIEMRQVGARDEARLVADYEKCGQHCCCRQFLKVLKPVSMKNAKIQKATLDPSKISGRCGRLMCCLRYEEATYEDLRKRLPPRNARVMTEDGPGTVISTQILTQLVLVAMDTGGKRTAYPVENIRKLSREEEDQLVAQRPPQEPEREERPPARRPRPGRPLREEQIESREVEDSLPPSEAAASIDPSDEAPPSASTSEPASEESQPREGEGQPRRRRRRRRGRRKRGRGRGPDTPASDAGPPN